MNLSQKQIIIVSGILAVVLVVGGLIYFNLRGSTAAPTQLTVWGFEKESAFAPLISGYRALHPNVSIAYKQVGNGDYENTLLNALASGRGPDVFPIHNRGVAKNANVLLAAAPSQFSANQVQSLFPLEVESDFVLGGYVYALPLYFDTLALVYNKDLFDQGSVANPPATWDEFQSDVTKLRYISQSGQITRAGAAIGGSQKTVSNATDILGALMLQNGTKMPSGPNTQASFTQDSGQGAFDFYLKFANSNSDYYTWNDSQPNDFDSFSAGKTAMVFGYYSDVQKILAKSPFLRFGVAALPQINPQTAVNYADYWGLAVSKQSKNPSWAWDFVIYAATQQQAASQYLGATGQPPALRDLIAQKISDSSLGVFAKQSLSARSWYQPDEKSINNILNNAITGVLSGNSDSRSVLAQAEDQINLLLKTQ